MKRGKITIKMKNDESVIMANEPVSQIEELKNKLAKYNFITINDQVIINCKDVVLVKFDEKSPNERGSK